VAHLIMATAL